MIQYLLCLFLSLSMHLHVSGSMFSRASQQASQSDVIVQQKEIDRLRTENTRLHSELEELRSRLEAAEAHAREVHGHLEQVRRERVASTERHRDELEQEKLTHRERAAMAHEEILSRKLEHQKLKEKLAARSFADVVRRRLLEKRKRELIEEKENALRLTHELEIAKLEIDDFRAGNASIDKAIAQMQDPHNNPFYNQKFNLYDIKKIPTEDVLGVKFPRFDEKLRLLIQTPAAEAVRAKDTPRTPEAITNSDITDSAGQILGHIKEFFIVNSKSKEKNLIFLTIVHGTFSNAAVYYGDKNLVKSIFIFAQQLALAHEASVRLSFFQWSGALDKQDRLDLAGQKLAEKIQADSRFAQTKTRTPIHWVIAHSHGCNVTHNAAQHLKKPELQIDKKIIPIDTAILCASPAFDIDPRRTEDKTHNIKKIFHFYGKADTTARAGTLFEYITQGSKQSLLRKEHATSQDELVFNIRTLLNGYDTNHLNIVDVVIRYLADILDTLAKDFPINYDLVMNIFPIAMPNSSEEEGSPDVLYYWRPKFAIAQTDLTNLMIHKYPQYLNALHRSTLDIFSISMQKSQNTLTIFESIYNRSMYEFSPLPTVWGESIRYGFGDLHDIPHRIDILYNNSFDPKFTKDRPEDAFNIISERVPSPRSDSTPASRSSSPSSTLEESGGELSRHFVELTSPARREEIANAIARLEEDKRMLKKPTTRKADSDSPRVSELINIYQSGSERNSGGGGGGGGGGKSSTPTSTSPKGSSNHESWSGGLVGWFFGNPSPNPTPESGAAGGGGAGTAPRSGAGGAPATGRFSPTE
ncbi:hypothetical protein EBQ93_03695 [bacterium]|nr:hypothetical protein [bacterium]